MQDGATSSAHVSGKFRSRVKSRRTWLCLRAKQHSALCVQGTYQWSRPLLIFNLPGRSASPPAEEVRYIVQGADSHFLRPFRASPPEGLG